MDPRAVELVGFVAETLLYGVHLTLWIVSTSILFDRHRHRRPVPTPVNKLILAGSCLICAAVTGRWVVDCIRLWRGLLCFQGVLLGDRLYFAQMGDGINVTRGGFLVVSGWVLDALLVYRVYIIWEASMWHVFLPALGLLGFLVSAAAGVYTALQPPVASGERHAMASVIQWSHTVLALSLATNLIAALLIASRIVLLSRTLHAVGVPRTRRGLVPVVRIVIESAMVSCVFHIATLATSLTDSPVFPIIWNITNPVIGINFSLIIIRVQMDLGTRPSLSASPPEATWFPTMTATLEPHAHASGGLEYESQETVLHASAPTPLGVVLPHAARIGSEA